MTWELNVTSLSLLAYGDYTTTGQYRFVYSSGGKARTAGAGARAIGVLQNKPYTDEEASVMVYGVSKVICGAGVAENAEVASDSAGAAVTAASSAKICGIALAAGDTGDIIPVLLTHGPAV